MTPRIQSTVRVGDVQALKCLSVRWLSLTVFGVNRKVTYY